MPQSTRKKRKLNKWKGHLKIILYATTIVRGCTDLANDPFLEPMEVPAYVKAWDELPPDLARLMLRVRSLVGHALAYTGDDLDLGAAHRKREVVG